MRSESNPDLSRRVRYTSLVTFCDALPIAVVTVSSIVPGEDLQTPRSTNRGSGRADPAPTVGTRRPSSFAAHRQRPDQCQSTHVQHPCVERGVAEDVDGSARGELQAGVMAEDC